MTDRKFVEFWEERARAFGHTDPQGWAAVCHRDAPLYFNRFIDWSQRRAFARLLTHVPEGRGEPAVDLGCGTGRWTRKLYELGFAARGFDISPAMIERAKELAPHCQFDVGVATQLPLPDASQQVVACVTVLHHLPPSEQVVAAGEIVRVLRPGGFCIIMVLRNTLPAGAWCYPRNRRDWERLFVDRGLTAVAHVGEEYLTPAMLMHWLASGVLAVVRGPSRGARPGVGNGRGPLAALYRTAHKLAVGVSIPIEAAAASWWPNGPAVGLASLYAKPLPANARTEVGKRGRLSGLPVGAEEARAPVSPRDEAIPDA